MASLSRSVNAALLDFQRAKSSARRFHRDTIGDVDPEQCLSDFLCKVRTGDEAGIAKSYGPECVKGALTSTSGAAGGYLIPDRLAYDIMEDVGELAFIRPRATIVEMDSRTIRLPLPSATTASGTAGVTPFFGTMQMRITGEAEALTESEPAWSQLELTAWELTGLAYSSRTFVQDVKNVDSLVGHLFAKAIAWFEDFYFLQGNGAGTPLGMLNSGATINVTRNTASEILYVDAANMLKKLLPHSFINAIWIISVSSIAQLVQLVDSSGKTSWVPNDRDRADGNSMGSMFGRPIYVTEKTPALGTTGDLMLIDPSLYAIGDRSAITVDVSDQEPTTFTQNRVIWRVVERVDGQPFFGQTITLQDGSTVVSPYVALHSNP